MLSHVISIPFVALHSTYTALQMQAPQSSLLPCRRNVSFPANSYPLKRRNTIIIFISKKRNMHCPGMTLLKVMLVFRPEAFTVLPFWWFNFLSKPILIKIQFCRSGVREIKKGIYFVRMFTLNMPFITIKKLRCLFLKPIVKMPQEKNWFAGLSAGNGWKPSSSCILLNFPNTLFCKGKET